MLSSNTACGDRYHSDLDVSLSLAMSRSARRGPWLPEEDQALLQLVRTQGANNWVRISQQIQHRSPKQCRERYHQNLKPSLKHDPISAQEGELIERLVQEMGKRWAEIARRLGNRSDNAVKNWWNGSVNRRRRNPAQPTNGFKQVGSRLQPVPFTISQPMLDSNHNIHHLSYEDHRQNARSHRLSALHIPNATHRRSPSSAGTSPIVPFHSPAIKSDITSHNPSLGVSRSYPSETRPELPPLRSSIHLSLNEKIRSTVERPPISPAFSDASQKHAPSLISDSQSMHSISPRIVTTPRPGVPAPVEIGGSSWPEAHAMTQYTGQQPYKPSIPIEVYGKISHYTPYNAAFHKFHNSVNDDKFKDSRMNVSTLLQ